ncbi:AAA family ATPase [Actinoplanes sp. NBC_00393]|uniref:AAA family ATPase n=1 Tax=Actinoplanes sp. NBC_00393 TaxID=2975953 RepID=UPI002E1A81B5
MAPSGSAPRLLGRRAECETLSSMITATRAGRSQVLILRGEAGIGKTALIEFLVDRAAGCRVRRAAGVESLIELAHAGLHQLCAPFLDRLDRLPEAQRTALCTAFGLQPGHPPDRFLLGLAVLTLLSEVADEQPLVCVVDDAQWLDQASAQTLEFVAGRLGAEPVAMVFATRDDRALAGLPGIRLRGLDDADAVRLLDTAVTGPLDPRVRDRILADSHGNPLALLEFPRVLSAAELAFGGAAEVPGRLAHRLEDGFLRQAAPLPEPSRRLLLVAAAEPVGDVALLWRAAEQLGVDPDAAGAAEAAGLIEFPGHDRFRFRHPLIRSAVYRSAAPAQRREAHRAIADVTDARTDPDRQAWHRARAAVNPDESVAAELERSAGRALARGGLAAAAAFHAQAATLTPDPAQRIRRCLDAAQAKVHAGAFDDALALLAAAHVAPLHEAEQARVDLIRAQISFATNRGNEALPLLLAAARRLEPLDPGLARDTYLDALSAALFAGRLAQGPGARQVAEAVQAGPPAPAAARKGDVLLDGLAVLFTEGYPAAAPLSHRAVQSFAGEELSIDEGLRFSWLAASAAVSLWDDDGWDTLTRRHLEVARAGGALGALPLALTSRVFVHLFTGDLAAAASLVDEIQAIAEITHGMAGLAPYGEVSLAAVRGQVDRAEPMIRQTLDALAARGEGVGVNMMQWARAVLFNGAGRYPEAVDAAREASTDPLELGPPKWALAELVEAQVRSGDTKGAAATFEQLAVQTRASGTEWALGVEASRRALLRDDSAAEELYREAIERLGSTRIRVDLARAQLLYGEWLRRAGRRLDAREQLRAAYESLVLMGLDGFAERARHELLATGQTVRKRSAETPWELTAQEAHIARLAAEGLTNPEIGAALYISPRTVEWHLRRIFSKLGVSTRRELRFSHARPPARQ